MRAFDHSASEEPEGPTVSPSKPPRAELAVLGSPGLLRRPNHLHVVVASAVRRTPLHEDAELRSFPRRLKVERLRGGS